jgi:hypothetical protein
MKKFMFLVVSLVAVFALSGCGGDSDDYNDYDDKRKFHLVDQDGYGISDIKYTCDGDRVRVTDGSGGFYFYPNDHCTFELDIALDLEEDRLYIANDDYRSVGGVPYTCTSGLAGQTDRDGYFKFYEGDICTFQL